MPDPDHPLLRMQRTAGNRAVLAWLGSRRAAGAAAPPRLLRHAVARAMFIAVDIGLLVYFAY